MKKNTEWGMRLDLKFSVELTIAELEEKLTGSKLEGQRNPNVCTFEEVHTALSSDRSFHTVTNQILGHLFHSPFFKLERMQ